MTTKTTEPAARPSLFARAKEALFKKVGGPIFRAALRLVFRFHNAIAIKGLENIRAAGDRVIYIANHASFVDAAIMASHIPGNPTFAVNLGASRWWWMRAVMPFFNCVVLDTRNPMAIKTLVRLVESGRPIVIYPEGRLTVTNGLMKAYNGSGMVADKADAHIVPIRLEGVHFSPLSRLGKLNPTRFGAKFTMTVLPPRKVKVDPALRGAKRREAIGDWLYDEMVAMMAATERANRTLFAAFLDAVRTYGAKSLIAENVDRATKDIVGATYGRLLTGAMALGRIFERSTAKGEYVGLLMPNANSTVAAFMALQSIGRVPAMLNYSTGPANMRAAIAMARIRTVITSRAFVEAAKLGETVAALGPDVTVVYLEDLAPRIGTTAKLRALRDSRDAESLHAARGIRPDDPAVVIFTSGSEGTPKGVVLSHRNLLSNMAQLQATVDFSPADMVMNALPMFHSFGLTAGTLLPLMNGIKVFLFPNPLDYKTIPELVYDRNATILFGTDTFLTGYARKAHRADLLRLRYVFAGAEKVKDATRRVYMEKFQKAIYEGYGATECAPVIATNTPMAFRIGTVGRLMPLIEHRLEAMPGVERGGRLFVKGPNVMLGYLRVENPGVIERLADGWYDTGDIVDIDAEGYVTILGRAKRFAKVAGEMISLAAVETQAARVWPQGMHACVAVDDDRKGQQLVLLTTEAGATRADLLADARGHGISEIAVPRSIRVVAAVPLLGTGKTDYAAAQRLAEAALVLADEPTGERAEETAVS